MSGHRGRILRIERTFAAPLEQVFEAWTSEEVLRRWPHGMLGWETPTAEVDLRVGGRVRVVMRDPSTGAERGATGEYTVVEPPHRLAFTWMWYDDAGNPQLIELEFSEREGVSTVVMINSDIPTERQEEEQESGWQVSFDTLERTLASPPSRSTTASSTRPTRPPAAGSSS
jgi:uncharacterized protein YndB with AHSA1/START domain